MKTLLIAAAALALSACATAPVTPATHAFCSSLPAARLAEDIALASRGAKAEELAAVQMARALVDARCAQAASAPK